MTTNNAKILVQLAMAEEWPVHNYLINIPPILDYRERFPEFLPTHHSAPVIAMGVALGKVSAASSTVHAITCLQNVKAVIGFGYCGALRDDLTIGTIIVSQKLVQYDYGSITEGGTWLARPGDRTLKYKGVSLENGIMYMARNSLVEMARITCQDLGLPYFVGTIATGDTFVTSLSNAQDIKRRCNADAIDMESAAVAQVCTQFKIPYLFMKTVSDIVGLKAEEQYLKTISSENIASKHFTIIEKIIKHIS